MLSVIDTVYGCTAVPAVLMFPAKKPSVEKTVFEMFFKEGV